MYSNYPMTKNGSTYYPDEERFFWAPFVVGGLAGTALGYGIANNQQMNQQLKVKNKLLQQRVNKQLQQKQQQVKKNLQQNQVVRQQQMILRQIVKQIKI